MIAKDVRDDWSVKSKNSHIANILFTALPNNQASAVPQGLGGGSLLQLRCVLNCPSRTLPSPVLVAHFTHRTRILSGKSINIIVAYTSRKSTCLPIYCTHPLVV